MVYLKRHVSECHVRVIADDEKHHFLRERCGFFLAINPEDYKRAIGIPEEGPASDYLKDAVRGWCSKNPKGRSITEWEKGWRSVEPYSPTKPQVNTTVIVTMAQSGVHAVLWEGDKDYRRVTVSPAVIGHPKKREALFRRMAVAQTQSDLPPCLDSWTSCEDVPSDRLARCLGVDIGDIVLIEDPLTLNARSPTLCPISPLPESPKISLHFPQKSPPRKVQKRDPDISLSAVAAPSHSGKLTFEQLFNDFENPSKSPNTSSPTYHPKSPVEVPTCQPKSPVEVISSADGHHTPLKSLTRPLQAPPSTQPLPKSLSRQLQAPQSTQPLPKSLPRQLQAPPSTQRLPKSRRPVCPAQNTPVLQVWPNSSPVAPRQLLIPPSPGSVSSRVILRCQLCNKGHCHGPTLLWWDASFSTIYKLP
ncbi:hypothetical protein DPMN_048043 [Dreissena polymorpha]|uniref:Uncharacterized protein n=1 Tax=Dreissena polymorpha TaxID=45954 RepID=A0A9D4DAI4_DREPO|nr:hypothetical protein DPMN_048043 [Dreissena polymorpha]